MINSEKFHISPDLDALIGAIYRGPLEHSPWQGFLDLLCEAMDANYATLLLRPPSELDSGIVINAASGSEQLQTAYRETWFALDPFVNLPPGQVLTLQEFVDREQLLASEYYQRYIQPLGVFHILGVDIEAADGLQARLRVTHGEDRGDFSDDDKALCRQLLPHLQQSIILHASLKRTESERALYADAIDQLAMGSVILDAEARVLSCNRVAETLLAQHPSLKRRGERLVVGDDRDNREFRALLEQVLAAHRQGQPGFVKAFGLGLGDAEGSLGLLLRPLPRVASSTAVDSPAVAIFISDPNRRRTAPAEVLVELFGFTPAEASLALLLANGLTLDEAAAELGVSRNTTKSHLSAVFAKTGVSRQTRLVQLILKSVAPFGA